MSNSFLCMIFRSDLATKAMKDKNLPSGLYSDLIEGRTCFVCLKVSEQLANINGSDLSSEKFCLLFARLWVLQIMVLG